MPLAAGRMLLHPTSPRLTLPPYDVATTITTITTTVTAAAAAGCASPQVYAEGTHLMVPWFERPIIYDVRARPSLINSQSGSRDLQMVRVFLAQQFPCAAVDERRWC